VAPEEGHADDEVIRREIDAAVVGGGVAGCMGVVPAAGSSLEDVTRDKGKPLERSGSDGGGGVLRAAASRTEAARGPSQ